MRCLHVKYLTCRQRIDFLYDHSTHSTLLKKKKGGGGVTAKCIVNLYFNTDLGRQHFSTGKNINY